MEEALTVPEVADKLRCSVDMVYDLISAGDLKRVNIALGKKPKTRVLASQLDEFLLSREVA